MTGLAAREASSLVGYTLSARPGLQACAEQVLARRDLYILAAAGYGKSGLLGLIAASRPKAYIWTPRRDSFEPEQADAADLLIADLSIAPDRQALRALRAWLQNPARKTPALIAARSDPGLGLARLVANTRGVIWRTGDMRCSLDDLRSVLLHAESLATDAARLNEMHQVCDGWIAGAVLLHSEQGASSLTQHLPQSVREYYSDILRSADLPIDRDLLSLSALPDQISPRLFQHITASGDFFALIESGIDLQPVANAPGWWRFGGFLSAYLRERAMALGGGALSSAHRRISDWHLGEGALTESALHALQSGDDRLAMNIVDKAARRFIALGQITHARSWLTHLEPHGRSKYPRIWLHLITALIVSSQFEAADAELAELGRFIGELQENHQGEDWFDEIVLHMQFNQHMLAHMHPQRQCDLSALTRLVETPRSRDFAVRGEALFLKGFARLHQGDEDGYSDLEDSLKALIASESWYAYANTQRHLALRDLERGRLEACRDRCVKATAQIVESTCFAPPCLAPITMLLAELELVEGKTEQAHRILANERMPLQVLANEDLLAEWDRLTGELHIRAGARSDADHMFRQVLARRISNLGLMTLRKAETALVQNLCQMQRVEDARAHLGDRFGLNCPAGTPQTPGQLDVLEDVVRSAIVMTAQGQCDRARRQLSQALPLIERREGVLDALRVSRLILEFKLDQDIDLALRRQVRDWISKVREVGADGLVDEARCGPHGRHYGDDMGRARMSVPVIATRQVSSEHVQLTPKEQETLEYIAIGHTNRQIADQTMTSLTTVKWHVRNILAKLEAQNRAAAINTARRLGLIP